TISKKKRMSILFTAPLLLRRDADQLAAHRLERELIAPRRARDIDDPDRPARIVPDERGANHRCVGVQDEAGRRALREYGRPRAGTVLTALGGDRGIDVAVGPLRVRGDLRLERV